MEVLVTLLARAERGYKERLSLWMTQQVHALHGQPINFKENCVILHSPCGGTVGKLATCYQAAHSLQLIAKGSSSETLCHQIILVCYFYEK